MSTTRGLAFALAVLAAGPLAAAGALAAEQPSAADLLQRAIETHGGRAALSAWPDLELEGTVENLQRQRGRSEYVRRERADGAYRDEVTFERGGRKFTPVTFYDGHAVKRRFGQAWDDLPVVESEEEAAHRLPWLLAIDADAARLEGEGRVDDVATWTVSVPDGRGRATLQLAQDDGRLVGLTYPGTAASGMGTKEEVERGLTFRDFRQVGRLLLPFDVETAEKGTPQSRVRWESIRVLDGFDEEWIRVPDPTRRFIPPEELAF